jgi:tetratricopeptide (TPR) repeat protein
VLAVATDLAGSVREALGDTTSDSVKRFAMEKLSSVSIDAVREYAKGLEAMSSAKFDDALQRFGKAIELDPNFGVAYGASSGAALNLDRPQEAVKFADEAMRHLDGMTDRERFRTRGMYHLITNNYGDCVKEYGDLLAKYPADPAARNNRAYCLTQLRDFATAVQEVKEVVKILPNRALYRENLALYTAYSGDFAGAGQQVNEMASPGLFALLARAYGELGEGRLADAARTYQTLPAVDSDEGPSYMASGLGDLAIFEGRYADAVRILTEGSAADVSARSPDKAASKAVAAAYAHLQLGQKAAAMAAAEQALALSPAVKIQFLAGRIFIEAGAVPRAERIAIDLGGSLKAEPQAYASILEGLRALSVGNNRLAVKSLTDANSVLDTWIGHFDLGRAYLAAGAFPQADSEFDRCLVRKGETLSLFLDEEPTFGLFPPALYYQGRVREGLKSLNFADSYRAYLQIRGNSNEDPLVADARKRAGQ